MRITLIAMMFIILLTGCCKKEVETNPNVLQKYYRQGYEQGTRNLAAQLKSTEQQWRQKVTETFPKRLPWGTLGALLVIFGSERVLEFLRYYLRRMIFLAPQTESLIIRTVFLILLIGGGIWSLYRCGLKWSIPVMLLLLPTIWITEGPLNRAILAGNSPQFRLCMAKLKSIGFLVLTILLLYELLHSSVLFRLFPV